MGDVLLACLWYLADERMPARMEWHGFQLSKTWACSVCHCPSPCSAVAPKRPQTRRRIEGAFTACSLSGQYTCHLSPITNDGKQRSNPILPVRAIGFLPVDTDGFGSRHACISTSEML